MKWVTFFSQTGTEIVELSNALGKTPDLIVTNNSEEKIKYNPELRNLNVVLQSGSHEQLMEYFRHQNIFNPADTLITLHGYLKIIPEDICSKYEIYNGHPGYITKYPELKGKDPQVFTWAGTCNGMYPFIGSVVHRVTPGVDEGEVVSVSSSSNNCNSLEEIYGALKELSLQSWIKFLKEKGL